jgi:hypothetical protein
MLTSQSGTRKKRTSGCIRGRSGQPTGMEGQGHMVVHQEARRCHIDLIAATAGRNRQKRARAGNEMRVSSSTSYNSN